MSMQLFEMTPARIGKFKGHMFKRGEVKELLTRQGRQVSLPMNRSDTYVGRYFLPYGATSTNANTRNRFHQDADGDRAASVVTAHQSQEGVTPTPDSLTTVDTTVVVQEYEILYGFSSKQYELHEDNFPAEMLKIVAERRVFVDEMIVWGSLKACTNAYYGGSGTSLATVNGGLTLNLLRRISTNLMANRAMPVNQMLKAGPDFEQEAVEEGFVVYCHTDLCPDIRNLPNFQSVKNYANGKPLPREIGSCEDFRFVVGPDFPSFQNGGAAVGATGLSSTTGTNIDVYPFVVLAQDAFSQISVRGAGSMDPTYLTPGKKDKSDPTGKRGYIWLRWYKATMIENAGWMAAGHCGAKSLS